MSKDESKITVAIDPDIYYAITKNMQYGQMTHIVRKFADVMFELTESGQMGLLLNWVYDNKEFTLKQPGGYKNDNTNADSKGIKKEVS